MRPNGGHFAGDPDLSKVCTPAKGVFSDDSDPLGDRDLHKIFAICEGADFDLCHLIRNFHGCQAFASEKCFIVDLCHTFRNIDRGEAFTVPECLQIDAGQAWGQGDPFQRCAFVKSQDPYIGHAVREQDFFQVMTACEGFLADMGHPLRDGKRADPFPRSKADQFRTILVIKNAVMRTVIPVSAPDIESLNIAAFRKSLAADLCYTVGNRNMLQAAASPEGSPDLPDPFGKRDVRKAGTPFKHGVAEIGNASRDGNTFQVGTIEKRPCPDTRH